MERDWEQAIESGDTERVRSKLEQAAADGSLATLINSKDQHGQTGLMVAATRGQTAVVQLLLGNNAELNHTAKYHLSALMLATINHHTEIVRLLVEAGADLEIRGSGAPGFSGLAAQELAEKAGYGGIAELLRSAAG